MGVSYWERHPDGPFATLIAVAGTYCTPEATTAPTTTSSVGRGHPNPTTTAKSAHSEPNSSKPSPTRASCPTMS